MEQIHKDSTEAFEAKINQDNKLYIIFLSNLFVSTSICHIWVEEHSYNIFRNDE